MMRDSIPGMIMGVLIVSVLKPKTTLAATKADYYSLYDHLFDSTFYKANVRPAVNESYPIMITLDFWLHSIINVNEKEQTLTTSGTIRTEWDDNYLAWHTTDYGDIPSLLVPQKLIYLPDVIVANSVTETTQLGYPQMYVRLNYDGKINWGPTTLLETACDIDITYFPFDTQICYIEFETAVSTVSEIVLVLDKNYESVTIDDFSSNGQWQLLALNASEHYEDKEKSFILFGLQIKRRKIFYVLNIVLPIFFLSLTASLVFALPADEGEKMGTGITVLLAFAVYLTIVSDLVPNTSLQVSILGVYLTTLLGLSAISVIAVAFTLRLHFREEDIPVGPRTTRLTLLLKRVTCSKKDDEHATNKVVPAGSRNTKTNSLSKDTSDNNTISTSNLFVDETKTDLSWKQVAKALDDFFFILFSALSVIITLFCMLTLSVGGALNAPQLENAIYVNDI